MITEREYYQECRGLARDAWDEAKTAEPDGDFESWRDAAGEYLWDTVDGHEWVIYYHHARALCFLDPYPGGSEMAEDIGVFSEAPESFCALCCKLAFCHLYCGAQTELWALADVEEENDDNDN